MPRALMKVDGQRSIRELVGRIDVAASAASIGAGKGFSVTYVAAGKYKITFKKAGRKIVYAAACPIESTDATGHSAKVKAKTEATDITFSIYAADGVDGVLVDNVSFYFRVVLEDHA